MSSSIKKNLLQIIMQETRQVLKEQADLDLDLGGGELDTAEVPADDGMDLDSGATGDDAGGGLGDEGDDDGSDALGGEDGGDSSEGGGDNSLDGGDEGGMDFGGGGGFGGGGFGNQMGGSDASSEISTWVQENFTATTIDGSTLYDLTAPAA